jgi:hypothetical protein
LDGRLLSLEQTDLVNEGQTISGKSMRAFGAINHQEAIVFIKNSIQRMSFLVKRIVLPAYYHFTRNFT